MNSAAARNYLRVIYENGEEVGEAEVPTGVIAKRLAIVQSTATVAIQRLARKGLVEYLPYHGVRLTEAGRRIALQSVRVHRLLEVFLHRVLCLNWMHTHQQAQLLEAGASPWLIERIDEHLQFPTHCPHGDPIPRADGSLPESPQITLAALPAGTVFSLARISGHSSNLLRYLNELGLAVGSRGRVIRGPAGSAGMNVEFSRGPTEICPAVAKKLLVVVE